MVFSFLLFGSILAVGFSLDVKAKISIKTSDPIHVTDERFLSLGMDSNLIRDRWETFDFKSVRLVTLAKGLAPAYLRLSGTDGDRMIFNATNDQLRVAGLPPFPNTPFSMTVQDWDKINAFCNSAGWDLMFGFNGQLRFRVGNKTLWNPTNAIDLLDYSVLKGYNKHLHFQLGNEPNYWYNRKTQIGVAGADLAEDFRSLRTILNSIYTGKFDEAVIVGPDISGLRHAETFSWLIDYLNHSDTSVIQALSFHHYYGGGDWVQNYTDINRLDSYIPFVQRIKDMVARSKQPKMPIWNTETSSTGYPSKTKLEEAYVASFMLLDHLGISARMGLDVVMRQTFYGFWFALVDNALLPRPAYWFALLFKQLVGPKVLDIDVSLSGANDVPRKLRLYAHCTVTNKHDSVEGSVTVYGMNLYDNDVVLNFGNQNVEEYLLTTDYLSTAITYLNGNRLVMPNNSTLPDLKPNYKSDGSKVTIPSNTIGLYVLPNLKAKACM